MCPSVRLPPSLLTVRPSIPIARSTPKTAVFVGRRLGGSERTRSHHLVCAAHQISHLAQDGLVSRFESRQVDLSLDKKMLQDVLRKKS